MRLTCPSIAFHRWQRNVDKYFRVKGQRLIALFLVGSLLFNYPLLALFSTDGLIFGIPVLIVYIFFSWAVIIALMTIVIEFRK